MSVVLTILSVVLIIILFLLSAALIISLIVFLLPVKYDVSLCYRDKLMTYNINVSWLAGLIGVSARQAAEDSETEFRVAWKGFAQKVSDAPGEEAESEADEERVPPGPHKPHKPSGEKRENKNETASPKDNNKAEKEEKSGIIAKIKEFYGSYKEFKELNISASAVFKEVLLLLKRLFNAFKPKIFDADLEIGFETPDVTGMAIGAAAVAQTFINTGAYSIAVRGNFEREVVNLKARIKGKLVLWFGLWPFIRLCFSKPIKPIRKIILGQIFKSKKKKTKTKGGKFSGKQM